MSVLPNSSFADKWAPALGQGNQVYKSDQQSKALMGYSMIPDKFYLNKPTRNALGLVGGNEVSVVTSSPMVDVESDLQGITRPNTKCNFKQYVPECALGGLGACPNWPSGIRYTNAATGERRFIATRPTHLPTSQMNSYQGVNYPTQFVQETGNPWRF
jgi:hypothetical protein